MSSHPKTHIFSFNLSLNAPWFEKLAFEKNTMYFTLVILQSSIEKTNHVQVCFVLSTTQRPYFFVNFWLSSDDPTYFCIFLSLNAENHALTQWPLIFWACALTECPSLLEGGPYTRIHFIFDCPPPPGNRNPTNIRRNIKIKIYTFNITINVIGLGGTNLFFAQYLKLHPFSETCNMGVCTLW